MISRSLQRKLIGAFMPLMILSIAVSASAQQAKSATTPITVGATAPDFTLSDQDGNTVALADARGKSPVILVFYRGYW